jgi:hypothetical protein
MSSANGDDTPGDPDLSVEVTGPAVEYLSARGGSLYIWVDGAGLLRKATQAPSSVTNDWITIPVGDITVHVASDAATASTWRIALRRFPLRRLDVTTDLTRNTLDTGSAGIF